MVKFHHSNWDILGLDILQWLTTPLPRPLIWTILWLNSLGRMTKHSPAFELSKLNFDNKFVIFQIPLPFLDNIQKSRVLFSSFMAWQSPTANLAELGPAQSQLVINFWCLSVTQYIFLEFWLTPTLLLFLEPLSNYSDRSLLVASLMRELMST